MERAMEQLNRLTRSLRRARTVELPEGEAPGERAPHFSEAGGRGGIGGRRGLRGRGRGRAAPWGSVGAEMPAGTGPAAGKGAVSPRTGAGWGRAGFA